MSRNVNLGNGMWMSQTEAKGFSMSAVQPGHKPDLHGTCYTHSGWFLTCDEYEGLLADYNRRCALCGKTDRYLNVDHDHGLGISAIRGVLCPRCNGGHMRRVDEGYRPICGTTRDYLMSPWYLARRGQTLAHDPAVHVSLGDLGVDDRARLRGALIHSWKAPDRMDHPGLAACIQGKDLRALLRLGWMREWRAPEVDIADPAGPTSRAMAFGRYRSTSPAVAVPS